MNPPIVLLTDFGLSDSYVGCLKAVIAGIHPEARVLDLCHGVGPQNILQAATILGRTYRFFPERSIFVCVVDPGVGTDRHAIAVRSRRYDFIGPDNGILSLAVGHETRPLARRLTNRNYFLNPHPSGTFHGRDIFAPVAAHLARAGSWDLFSELGPRLPKIRDLHFPKVKRSRDALEGIILYFDHFGNAITNIQRSAARDAFWRNASVRVGGQTVGPVRRTYGDGTASLAALFNSFDELEIALPNGSAQETAGWREGERVQISRRGAGRLGR